MDSKRKSAMRLKWLLILFSLIYGILMLWLDGGSFPRLYSPSPYHRLQADAFLQGHFFLADSIEAIRPGLAWHDGKVQQVWGLGVGMWLLPFEAGWRLFFGAPFPDRVALGLAFAMFAFYSGSTGLRIIRGGKQAFGLGLMWILMLCPALWTIARYSDLVFEETVLYALLISLGILVALVRFVLFGGRGDYWLCCALSSSIVWFRPTHCIYGVCGLVISSWVVWQYHRFNKSVVFGIGIWLLSVGLLAGTNKIRFGTPTEFGHRLTISSGGMVYLTRFGNPYFQASTIEAAKEMFCTLFLNWNVRGAGAFTDNQFPGQTLFPRWRRFDFTAFDFSYGIICAGAIMWSATWIFKLRKKWRIKNLDSIEILRLALVIWSGISIIALVSFYFYFPLITSRYLLDFAPAWVAVLILLWTVAAKYIPKSSVLLLAAWLVAGIATARTPVKGEQPSTHRLTNFSLATSPDAPAIVEFNGNYTSSLQPESTGIFGNGYGWDSESGLAGPVVSFAVDAPKKIEMIVSERRKQNGEPARKDRYRALIDGQSLPARQLLLDDDMIKVIFDIPEINRMRHQDQVLFLCFVDEYDMEDRNSQRMIYSIRWR